MWIRIRNTGLYSCFSGCREAMVLSKNTYIPTEAELTVEEVGSFYLAAILD
jgi:hypothetical protein